MAEQPPSVELRCPMPECDEELHLIWTMSEPLYAVWLGVPIVDDVPTPDSSYVSTWKVECMAGHVVLVPGDPGCECDDQGGKDCPHERDWSEESRTFRRHDAERLLAVVEKLAVARG